MKPIAERVALLFAVATLAAVNASAQFSIEEQKAAAQDPGYFTIDPKSVKLEKLGPTVNPEEVKPPADPGGDSNFNFENVINIATKVWAIIEKNKPVVDVKTQYATALPEGTKSWGQLDSWKPTEGVIYGFSAKNTYGMTVIDVRYQVLRTYGGGVKGRGKYLTAVTVEPLRVDVAWAYKFSMSAEVPDSSIVNVGSAENPVAAMTATLKWQISTAVKDSQGKGVYYLQGDGVFKELGSPFAEVQAKRADKLLLAIPRLPEFAVPAR